MSELFSIFIVICISECGIDVLIHSEHACPHVFVRRQRWLWLVAICLELVFSLAGAYLPEYQLFFCWYLCCCCVQGVVVSCCFVCFVVWT